MGRDVTIRTYGSIVPTACLFEIKGGKEYDDVAYIIRRDYSDRDVEHNSRSEKGGFDPDYWTIHITPAEAQEIVWEIKNDLSATFVPPKFEFLALEKNVTIIEFHYWG